MFLVGKEIKMDWVFRANLASMTVTFDYAS